MSLKLTFCFVFQIRSMSVCFLLRKQVSCFQTEKLPTLLVFWGSSGHMSFLAFVYMCFFNFLMVCLSIKYVMLFFYRQIKKKNRNSKTEDGVIIGVMIKLYLISSIHMLTYFYHFQ